MKNKFEFWLRVVLLLAILYSTSFTTFAQSSSQPGRKAKARSQPATVIDPSLTPAAGTTVAATDSMAQTPELVPKLKKRRRVAIVPAPPPGQIPVYVPERH